jgi:ubiquinone/menaquinone biosynthesis C-methylase UbiE
MTRLLRLPRGARILEIGCGRGIGLAELGRRLEPQRLVGLDIDSSFLEEAREHLDRAGTRAELVQADARRLPFPPASFDVVIDFGTCYHIAFASHAVSEVHRVLVHGGLFVHETRWAQLLSHPVRSFGRAMPHSAGPNLVSRRWACFWCARERRGDSAAPVISVSA